MAHQVGGPDKQGMGRVWGEEGGAGVARATRFAGLIRTGHQTQDKFKLKRGITKENKKRNKLKPRERGCVYQAPPAPSPPPPRFGS